MRWLVVGSLWPAVGISEDGVTEARGQKSETTSQRILDRINRIIIRYKVNGVRYKVALSS